MSGKTKSNHSRCPQAGALPPIIRERTVSIQNPQTKKYDSYPLDQTAKLFFFCGGGCGALLQVGNHKPVTLDHVQVNRLWEVFFEGYFRRKQRSKSGTLINIYVGKKGTRVQVEPTLDELGILTAARQALDSHITLMQRGVKNG